MGGGQACPALCSPAHAPSALSLVTSHLSSPPSRNVPSCNLRRLGQRRVSCSLSLSNGLRLLKDWPDPSHPTVPSVSSPGQHQAGGIEGHSFTQADSPTRPRGWKGQSLESLRTRTCLRHRSPWNLDTKAGRAGASDPCSHSDSNSSPHCPVPGPAASSSEPPDRAAGLSCGHRRVGWGHSLGANQGCSHTGQPEAARMCCLSNRWQSAHSVPGAVQVVGVLLCMRQPGPLPSWSTVWGAG